MIKKVLFGLCLLSYSNVSFAKVWVTEEKLSDKTIVYIHGDVKVLNLSRASDNSVEDDVVKFQNNTNRALTQYDPKRHRDYRGLIVVDIAKSMDDVDEEDHLVVIVDRVFYPSTRAGGVSEYFEKISYVEYVEFNLSPFMWLCTAMFNVREEFSMQHEFAHSLGLRHTKKIYNAVTTSIAVGTSFNLEQLNQIYDSAKRTSLEFETLNQSENYEIYTQNKHDLVKKKFIENHGEKKWKLIQTSNYFPYYPYPKLPKEGQKIPKRIDF